MAPQWNLFETCKVGSNSIGIQDCTDSCLLNTKPIELSHVLPTKPISSERV